MVIFDYFGTIDTSVFVNYLGEILDGKYFIQLCQRFSSSSEFKPLCFNKLITSKSGVLFSFLSYSSCGWFLFESFQSCVNGRKDDTVR